MRAAAIHAAIAKGRDYAAALGGQLRTVEHIADPWLVGGGQLDGGGQHWAPPAAGLSAQHLVIERLAGHRRARVCVRVHQRGSTNPSAASSWRRALAGS